MKKLLLTLLLPVMLAGCLAPTTRQVKIDSETVKQERIKQQELALSYLREMDLRLQDTAFPLLKSSDVFCEDDTGPAIGFVTASQFSYNKDFRDTANRLFGLDKQLQVIHVISNSPAEKAGFLVKDKLLKINGTKLPATEEAGSELLSALKKSALQPVTFIVERDGEQFDLTVTPDKQCNYRVLLSESDAVNAFADGSRVIVTKGMMKFASTDKELSLVISHEIAHNVMSHITSKTINSLGGTLLDIIASAAAGVSTQGVFGKLGASMYSQEFESEADYVGLYIMARAGQDTKDAELFWRRMAVEHPASITSNHTSSHPATPERFVSIEQTNRQIDEKRAAGDALMPDMQEGK